MKRNIIEGAVLIGMGLAIAGCGKKDSLPYPVPESTPSIEPPPAVLIPPEKQILPPDIYYQLHHSQTAGGHYYKEGFTVPEEFKKCFQWPVNGPISTMFGPLQWVPSFADPLIKYDYGHYGIDIDQGDRYGESVLAPADGIVEKTIRDDYGYGYYLIIDHGGGWKSLLAHNSDILVREDQMVHQGDAVSSVGTTGYSTGPHVHFELSFDDFMVNPLDYLPLSTAQLSQGTCGLTS